MFPHQHLQQIAVVSVSLKEACTPEFKECQESISVNIKAMVNGMMDTGINLIANGIDNHLAFLGLC